MRRIALGLLAGTVCVQQLTTLPDRLWSLALLVLLPVAFRRPAWRPWLAIPIGFLWASLMGNILLANPWPSSLVGQDIRVTGTIVSLPERSAHAVKFRFRPDTLHWQGQAIPSPGILALSWYDHAPSLNFGERWQLLVRLKPPHGFMNPGGFDHETWSFRRGIRARGYVRDSNAAAHSVNRYLAGPDWRAAIGVLRQQIQAAQARLLSQAPLSGLVTALAIGDRQAITPAQWDVLVRTGTSHLVAISGLHVGLVAGFVFFLMRGLWRRWLWACRTYPAAKAGAWAAMLAALLYSLLAGFSIPTQRALVMVCVVMAGILLQRQFRPGHMLALSLSVVLIMDPLAVLAPGFWLSFGAIAVIFYGMQATSAPQGRNWFRLWWRWGRVQWVVALGLLPVLVVLFQQASLVSPLANLVAVPWVSLVSVPLTLLGTLLLLIGDRPAQWVLQLAAASLDGLWGLLTPLADLPLAQWAPPEPSGWILLCAMAGIGWLLLPSGMPARWVGVIWLLPLGLMTPITLPTGLAHIALLDVGQGLATVVQTRRHVLVYDTGPRFPSGFNTGEAVLVPYLHSRGIQAIDTLVISHGDNDHAGGVAGLLRRIPARHILSGTPAQFAHSGAIACRAGQQWRWDGVLFEVIHPDSAYDTVAAENNRSCVIRISTPRNSVLLTGDIEQAVEDHLLNTAPDTLAATVLVVPHHGSATSSSAAFLDAVQPRLALLPVGYANRFGFPKPEVVARYRSRGIELYSTASGGALEFNLSLDSKALEIESYRQRARRYWHHRPG